jgi:hypothetical protein
VAAWGGLTRHILPLILLLTTTGTKAQQLTLETLGDTLSYLVLNDKGHPIDRWKLQFPVYQLQVGDVDGDGKPEALVGVVKTTRYDPVEAKRLFIFKNHHGRIRAQWMGSRLGGRLIDFRIKEGKVLSLQATDNGRYAVVEHHWRDFGLGFTRFIATNVTREEAMAAFNK